MKRMLFNATQQEELRVAIVDGQKLIDIDIETTGREQRKSNIYKGVITRIEPSLEACFVNYGEERHGFLPFKEVARSYFKEGVDVRNASIKEALREGQEIMIQVEKEERGNKGAALTSFISLAGRYLVLMPNNPRGGGVSRRVEGEDRQELRETMDKLDLPSGMSVIARTAGIGRNVDELQWDLNYLMQLWRAIEGAGQSAPGAFLIYQESSLVIRAIRDYFQPDIGEILIDTDDIHEQAQQFMSHVMPDMVHRVKRYRDDVPLFSRFQIEHQIETAYSRTVPLPSGGAIVIDHTEALVSVDVNSARATRGSDIETTAFNTNLEAADEVARQLRLRDLGGLIVIDFIDMESARNQREVEGRLKDALHYDRARVQMGKISRFGLMELSRQRLRPSLSEGSHVTCPRCNGTGHIRDTESSALQVLRIIQEEAMKENSAAIHVQVPVDVAAFLLNEKRGEILSIETRHRVIVILIPNKHLETPHYKLERIKHDDPRLEDMQPSYHMAEEADTDISYSKRRKEEARPRQEAVVKSITPEQAPIVERPAAAVAPAAAAASAAGVEGFLTRLFGLFRKKEELPATATPALEKAPVGRERSSDRGGRNNGRNRGRSGRGGRDRDSARGESAATSTDSSRTGATGVTAAAAATAGAATGQTANRQQRQPKEPRAPREAREAREPREPREQREGAEARRTRTPRPPRDERKEAGAESENTDLLTNVPALPEMPALAGIVPAFVTQAPAAPSDEQVEGDAGAAVAGAEEGEAPPRRRRRRGGRNRNRRELDGGNDANAEGASADGEDASTAETAPDGTSAPAAALTAAVIATAHVDADGAEAVEAVAHVAAPEPEAIESEAIASEAIASEAVEIVAAVAAAETAASIPVPEPVLAPVTVTPAEPEPEQAALPLTTPDDENTDAGVAVRETTVAAVEPAVAAEVVTEVVEEIATEVATEVVTEAAAEAVEPAVSPAATMPLDALRDVLATAGLQLATTDPDKLRAAQEAAARSVPAPRIPRERKPAPMPSSEPLVQVETRH